MCVERSKMESAELDLSKQASLLLFGSGEPTAVIDHCTVSRKVHGPISALIRNGKPHREMDQAGFCMLPGGWCLQIVDEVDDRTEGLLHYLETSTYFFDS